MKMMRIYEVQQQQQTNREERKSENSFFICAKTFFLSSFTDCRLCKAQKGKLSIVIEKLSFERARPVLPTIEIIGY